MLVYVKEAHPGDGDWPMPVPGRGMLNEPIGETARAVRATECVKELALDRYTVVVDDVSDTVNRAFAAWPERLAVIDVDGTLAFLGAPGPFGFDPRAAERALREVLDRRASH